MSTDPIKRRAQRRVQKLVRAGRLPRVGTLACVDCGGPASDYDHYLGYAIEHRLSIQPVCRRCHGKRSFARGERPAPPPMVAGRPYRL